MGVLVMQTYLSSYTVMQVSLKNGTWEKSQYQRMVIFLTTTAALLPCQNIKSKHNNQIT